MKKYVAALPFILPFIFMLMSGPVAFSQVLAASELSDEQVRAELDAFVEGITQQCGIPGISMAVIKNGTVLYRRNHGFANLEHEVPISNHSIFPLYSLTKPIVSVSIFQLIESGKLSLEDAISTYLDSLPQSWQQIKIKHLLSHSSGLADMVGKNPYELRDLTEKEARERIYSIPPVSAPGKEYQYMQTNYWLLKNILEKASGSSLSDFIIQQQFPDSLQDQVLFSSDARDIIRHRITPYFPWLKGELCIDLPYTNGDYFLATNGLHVTMDAFIAWDRMLNENKLLSPETRKAMWVSFPYEASDKEFGYGWGKYAHQDSYGYGFSGSMSTIYRTFPEQNLSIIFLTNGFTHMYSQDRLMEGLAAFLLE
ncbi:MAG: serine hydrolase domain-containing protein [Bacteroidota bacterium]